MHGHWEIATRGSNFAVSKCSGDNSGSNPILTLYKLHLFSIKCRINTKLPWRVPLVAGPGLPYLVERLLGGPTDSVR